VIYSLFDQRPGGCSPLLLLWHTHAHARLHLGDAIRILVVPEFAAEESIHIHASQTLGMRYGAFFVS
jgi:hypothetical protein